MQGLVLTLAVLLTALILLWAVIFRVVGRRARKPRPRLWGTRTKSGKIAAGEPVMSVADLETSFGRKKGH